MTAPTPDPERHTFVGCDTTERDYCHRYPCGKPASDPVHALAPLSNRSRAESIQIWTRKPGNDSMPDPSVRIADGQPNEAASDVGNGSAEGARSSTRPASTERPPNYGSHAFVGGSVYIDHPERCTVMVSGRYCGKPESDPVHATDGEFRLEDYPFPTPPEPVEKLAREIAVAVLPIPLNPEDHDEISAIAVQTILPRLRRFVAQQHVVWQVAINRAEARAAAAEAAKKALVIEHQECHNARLAAEAETRTLRAERDAALAVGLQGKLCISTQHAALEAERDEAKGLLLRFDELLPHIFWTSNDGVKPVPGEPEDADGPVTRKLWEDTRAFLAAAPPAQPSEDDYMLGDPLVEPAPVEAPAQEPGPAEMAEAYGRGFNAGLRHAKTEGNALLDECEAEMARWWERYGPDWNREEYVRRSKNMGPDALWVKMPTLLAKLAARRGAPSTSKEEA